MSAAEVRVEEELLSAVEEDDIELTFDEEGIEEKREADQDDKSSRVSFRRDSRGGATCKAL